jgi:hypothetical protein
MTVTSVSRFFLNLRSLGQGSELYLYLLESFFKDLLRASGKYLFKVSVGVI